MLIFQAKYEIKIDCQPWMRYVIIDRRSQRNITRKLPKCVDFKSRLDLMQKCESWSDMRLLELQKYRKTVNQRNIVIYGE